MAYHPAWRQVNFFRTEWNSFFRIGQNTQTQFTSDHQKVNEPGGQFCPENTKIARSALGPAYHDSVQSIF
jgi:hypothetical protein